MKYRVVFRERSDEAGEKADEPANLLDTKLDDDTVLDAVLVGRISPDGPHSSDRMEEDDSSLSLSSEIWEYDVAEGKDEDFKSAVLNSGAVMELEPLESGDELGLT